MSNTEKNTSETTATNISAPRIRCRDAARAVGAASLDPSALDSDYRALVAAAAAEKAALLKLTP